MQRSIRLRRTTTDDKDFVELVALLDHELWVELKEDQATYDKFNKVPHIQTAVLVYAGSEAVACGCFKEFDSETVEVKRMYVKKNFRGRGISKLVLNELEVWAKEAGYRYAVLETGAHFSTARKLYESNHYRITENYPPYVGMSESVCLRKNLQLQS